jgi:uncharacterized protein YfbU (UPF0304 family)
MSAQTMTERFEMRLSASVLQDVDNWRAKQVDLPSRAEAIRRLIEAGLIATSGKSEESVSLSDGDKLILLTLRDLFKELKLKSGGEMDLDFIAEAIFGGHSWGLKWEYSGIFHGHEDAKAVVSEVVDVLDMWRFMESGHERLSKKDNARVVAEAQPFGKDVKFLGFDGNDESEYLGVARFMIEKLGRFTCFKDRDLNAHMPTLDIYRRMLAVFEPIRSTLVGKELNADQLISILKSRSN